MPPVEGIFKTPPLHQPVRESPYMLHVQPGVGPLALNKPGLCPYGNCFMLHGGCFALQLLAQPGVSVQGRSGAAPASGPRQPAAAQSNRTFHIVLRGSLWDYPTVLLLVWDRDRPNPAQLQPFATLPHTGDS